MERNNSNQPKGEKRAHGGRGGKESQKKPKFTSARARPPQRPLPAEWSTAELPNTHFNSQHYVDLFCFPCWNQYERKTLLCSAQDIYRVYQGCFWIKNTLGTVQHSHEGFNEAKNVIESQLLCAECRTRIGGGYRNGYPCSEKSMILYAKLFKNVTGTKFPAVAWSGNPDLHTPLSTSYATEKVRDALERRVIQDAADEGILEFTEENVRALVQADVVLLRFITGIGAKQDQMFQDIRHQFLKYCDVKTGPSDWSHSRFIVLICFLGLHKKWKLFRRSLGELIGDLRRLKDLHWSVESSVLNKLRSWNSTKVFVQMQQADIIKRLKSVIPGFVSVPVEQVPRRRLYALEAGVVPEGATIGHFISLDLKSANFNTLKLLLPELKDCPTWQHFVKNCCRQQTKFPEQTIDMAAKLKYLRAKTLGKVAPKRISFCQHLIMRFLYNELVPHLPNSPPHHSPFLFTCDEMIIPISHLGAEMDHMVALLRQALQIKSLEVLHDIIRVERCSIEVIEAPELMKRNQPPVQASSSSSEPIKPSNTPWEDLKDHPFDGELIDSRSHADGDDADQPTSFYIRRGEDGKPQIKGLRYELRWEALKLAKLFDPKLAFKAAGDDT